MFSVLYVDDERDLLELCKIFLEQSPEFNVKTAASGREALELLSTHPFDAIISDYQMPGMDGIALLKTVRQQFGDIPFILFTGRGREEIVIEAINNGADFYLQKGGDVKAQFAELAHKIRQATARRQAEISLVESEKRLAEIIDFLPDATFAINRDGIIIAWNRAIEEMTGIAAETMLGKGDYEYAIPFYGRRRPILIDLIFAPDREVEPYYSNILRQDTTITAETNLPHPRGHHITVLAKAGPLYNRQGELAGAIEAIRDITERKKADDELRAAYEQITASEEELREQYDALTITEQQVRENASRLEYMLGFFERANNHEKDLMKYAVEGAGIVTGSPLGYLAFLSEDESELSMYAWSESAMKECAIREKPIIYKTSETGLWGEVVRQRRPVITNDYAAPNPAKKGYPSGHPVIVRHMNIPVIDNGRIVMIAGVANKLKKYTDDDVRQLSLLIHGLWQVIRERQIRQDLHKSEKRLSLALEAADEGLWDWDLTTNYAYFSPQYYRMLGYEPGAFDGSYESWRALVHPDDLPVTEAVIRTSIQERKSFDLEFRLRMQDGSWKWILGRGKVVEENDQGEPVRMAGTHVDISRRREIEEELRKSTAELDRYFTASLDLLCIADTDGYFRKLNPQWEPTLGYTITELVGKRFLDLVHPDDLQGTLDAIAALRSQEDVLNFTNRYRHKDGTYRWIEWRSKPSGDLIYAAARDITHHKEAEEALRQSEEKYRTILNNIQDVYYRSDREGNLIMASPSILPLLGYESLDEVLGKNIGTDIWAFPERREAFLDLIKKEGEVKDFEVTLRRRDGGLVIVSTSSHFYSGQDSRPGGVEGIFHDITAVQNADHQMQLIAGLMEISPASITVHADDGRFLYANQRTFELHGYAREEFLALNLHELDVPASEEHINERIDMLKRTGEAAFDVEHYRKDGSRIPLHVAIRLIHWNAHDAILSVATDLSERKKAEQALHDMERLYRIIVDNSHDVIYTLKPDGTLTFISPSWSVCLGHDQGEVLGKSFREFVHPEDIPACEDFLARTISSCKAQSGIEYRVFHKDGTIHWYRTTLMPVIDDTGAITTLVGNALDFTSYRLAEEALRKSEARYRSVIENIQDAFIRSDKKGNLIMASPSAATLFGYDVPEEILGRSITSFYQRPEIRPGLIEKMEQEKELVDQNIEFQRKDGTTFWGSVNAHFVYNAEGEPDGVECSIHDVSEYRAMEQAIREANRKLSLLNSITRHDVANQLTILQGFAQITAQRKGDPVVEDYLKKILAAAETITRQIEFTRTYQELGIQAPSWIPVEAVIERVASPVPIRFSKTCAGIEVFSDPMLERVFFNLVDNALRHGGRVTGITVRCEREPDGLLVIVEDNGIGIPPGEKEKIFTRGYGKNTGLGLFLAREILSITNISIRETGIEGRGARFEMLVPKNAFRVTAAKGR